MGALPQGASAEAVTRAMLATGERHVEEDDHGGRAHVRPKYDYDCRLDPNYDFDTWTIRGTSPPSRAYRFEADPELRCHGFDCPRAKAIVHGRTPADLAPFCSRCRGLALVAVRLGSVPRTDVAAWLTNPRRPGRRSEVVPPRPPAVTAGKEGMKPAAQRLGMPISTLLQRAARRGYRGLRAGLPSETWDEIARGWQPHARRGS